MISVNFYNENISTLNNIFLWANVLGGTVTAIFCFKAMNNDFIAKFKTMFAAIGALATAFALVYLSILITDINIDNWRIVTRGMQILAWPIVWIPAPWMFMRYGESYSKIIAKEVETQIKGLQK